LSTFAFISSLGALGHQGSQLIDGVEILMRIEDIYSQLTAPLRDMLIAAMPSIWPSANELSFDLAFIVGLASAHAMRPFTTSFRDTVDAVVVAVLMAVVFRLYRSASWRTFGIWLQDRDFRMWTGGAYKNASKDALVDSELSFLQRLHISSILNSQAKSRIEDSGKTFLELLPIRLRYYARFFVVVLLVVGASTLNEHADVSLSFLARIEDAWISMTEDLVTIFATNGAN
jgi:hypothetical protein